MNIFSAPLDTISGQPWYTYRDDVKAVKIENGIENLNKYAFSDCKNLSEMVFPETIEDIAKEALTGTDSLKRFYGYKNTAAQTYANENNIQFISLDNDNPGDVDGNNDINSYDALLTLQLITEENYSNTFAPSADADNDGTTTSYDALLILQKTINK